MVNSIDFEPENIKALAEILCGFDLESFKLAYDIALENKHIRDKLVLKLIDINGIDDWEHTGAWLLPSGSWNYENDGKFKIRSGSDQQKYLVRTFYDSNGRIQGDTYLLRMIL